MSGKRNSLTRENIKELLLKVIEEYEANEMDDSDEIYTLKKKVFKLSEPDKILFLLYVDLQSMAKVGEIFGVSPAAICHRLKKIKEILNK